MDAWPAEAITAAATLPAGPEPQEVVGRLTARLKAGDEAAWREFHAAYCHRLLRYLLVVTHGDEEVSRLVLQGAFIRAVRHMRRFESEVALWRWLTMLALSALRDERRKQRRYLAFLERWFAWVSVGTRNASDPIHEPALEVLLSEALTTLPEDEARLIERMYFEACSVRDIASVPGSTEKAVESRLARIRGKLKQAVLSRLHHESKPES